MQKILITGANGMLAKDIFRILYSEHKYEILCLGRDALNVACANNVKSVFESYRPNFTIHTAAITNVDYCEDFPDKALEVNTLGTENIGFFCNKFKCMPIYISSCGLFGDEIKSNTEEENVVLKTSYAKSKYYGEIKLKSFCNNYIIVRPGWLFGGEKFHKKNFVYKIYQEALEKPELFSVIDKYGCPTYTEDLSKMIIELIENECSGLYHITNSGTATRYDYVKKIIEAFNLNIKINPVTSEFYTRKAPVPASEMLENGHLKVLGFGMLPNWENAIEKYVSSITE